MRLAAYKDQDYQKILHWMETTSDFGRKFAAIKAIETFAKHPFLGVGFEVFLGEEIGGGYAVDNQYLRILVDTGLLGFIPFIMLLWVIFRTGSKAWAPLYKDAFTAETTLLMFLLLTGFCTILFSYLFADTLHIRSISGNLWLFAGAIFVIDRLSLTPENNRD
jgi:O-antigen ligase